jgi:immune inhibitor A
VNTPFFDSLIFSTDGTTVADYFSDASYGQIDLVTVNLPSSVGWSRAPQPYSYYVDSGFGLDSPYPNNSQGMVQDLVNLVDPQVDFSQYDNDGDGVVDVVMVIHSGPGAELSGDPNDIWSHQWGIPATRLDNVWISKYTVQPEYWRNPGDMTIGVYAHELAHGFGLPDLYDIDGDSWGIGRWGLMGHGAWLGPTGFGERPCHLSAWSKVEIGFATPTDIVANQTDLQIQGATMASDIYRIYPDGAPSNEYFLLENRQKSGYDAYLPSAGMLIWHIDDAKASFDNSDNSEQWYPGLPTDQHYRVALEQADGFWELEQKNDLGDAGDPFPGSSGASSFTTATTPAATLYSGDPTLLAIENIFQSAGVVHCDVTVTLASGVDDDNPLLPEAVNLSQNYPNPFNPTTHIDFSLHESAHVRIDVIDMNGRVAKTLIDNQYSVGDHSVSWDGSDYNGHEVASGVYIYRLMADTVSKTRKMTLVR